MVVLRRPAERGQALPGAQGRVDSLPASTLRVETVGEGVLTENYREEPLSAAQGKSPSLQAKVYSKGGRLSV